MGGGAVASEERVSEKKAEEGRAEGGKRRGRGKEGEEGLPTPGRGGRIW